MCTSLLWHAYLLHTSFNRITLLHTPELLPHTWPRPAQPRRACRKKGMRRGTVFHPCGGQSLWIRQPSLGPSPLGSGAQQAPSSPPRGRRPLKWAPRLQTPETWLCPVAAGGHWWLTPSLCLWTCHARDAELQLKTLTRTTENSHVVSESKPLSKVFVDTRDEREW